MNYINKANLYLQYFKSKDIVSLSNLFSNNIILKDWNINVNGYKNVVNQNKLIFDSLGDFDLLVSLNIFNSSLMNDAIYKFKRYEDSSLIYTGINIHGEDDVGLFDTVITREEFENY